MEAGNRAVAEVVEIENPDYSFINQDFFIRFHNMPKSSKIKIADIRTGPKNILIEFSGKIQKSSKSKSTLIEGVYQCTECGYLMNVTHEIGRIKKPKRCGNSNCAKKDSIELLDDKSKFIDIQEISVQELLGNISGSKVVHPIKVILKHDLTNKWKSNDLITITGVQKAYQKRQRDTEFDIRIIANHIQKIP